jgi:hypothetical protein
VSRIAHPDTLIVRDSSLLSAEQRFLEGHSLTELALDAGWLFFGPGYPSLSVTRRTDEALRQRSASDRQWDEAHVPSLCARRTMNPG